MLRYNQQQIMEDMEKFYYENQELRKILSRERVEARNTLVNSLRKAHGEQARLQKLLEERQVEMMKMKEELAKAREEIDSLYKLVNMLDK